jgi:hypothetical protein
MTRFILVIVTTPQDSHRSTGSFDKQVSNPFAPYRLPYLFTTAIFVGRPGAAFQQEPDDARLLLARMPGTAPSPPGGLNGKMKGRGAGLVAPPGVGAAIKECPDGRQRSCSHRPVQWPHSAPVQGFGISAEREEILDCLRLGLRIPMVGVRGVVKGLGAPTVSGMTVRPVCDEELCDRTSKRGGGHMESRVPGVKVVGDIGEKEIWRAGMSSADLSRRSCEAGTARQQSGNLVDLATYDVTNEIKKSRLYFWHWFLFRMSNLGGRRRFSVFCGGLHGRYGGNQMT